MSQLPGAFNANEYEAMNERTPIPKGDYRMKFVGSDKKESKKTAGNFYWEMIAEVEADVDGGTKFKGRKIYSNLNLINSNSVAVEIANKELKTMCDACGKVTITDTTELHGIPFLATVAVTPATATYPEGNEITFYKKLAGMAAPTNPASEKAGGEEAPKKKAWE